VEIERFRRFETDVVILLVCFFLTELSLPLFVAIRFARILRWFLVEPGALEGLRLAYAVSSHVFAHSILRSIPTLDQILVTYPSSQVEEA
jgi:hypothetical protein